jgi:copper chaperone CopZ
MKMEYQVNGMHCDSCIALIKMELGEIIGIKKVSGDYRKGKVIVEYDEKKTNVNEIARVIEKSGYKVEK